MRLIPIASLCLIFSFISFTELEGKEKKVFKATIDEDGIQRITVTGGEYFFDPDFILVKVNIPVEFTIKKEPGIVPHNIVIHEPEAGVDIRETLGTKPKIITFTPQKAGNYPFYCDKKLLFFKSHREKGMEGVFEVIE
jgi:plastocyanin